MPRRTLLSYFRYYHGSRLQLSLEKDSPNPRSVQPVVEIVAIPQVGGLHNLYERDAASNWHFAKRPARICALDHATKDFKTTQA